MATEAVSLVVAPIVEGHGEVRAVPILLRRIVREVDPLCMLEVLAPQRVPRSSLVKQGQLERHVEFAGRRVAGRGAVFVLIDTDTDCAATLGPELLQRASAARSDLPLSVVLATKEYEAWFIGAIESLRGQRRIANSVTRPLNPEAIGGAKGWISRHMPPTAPYDEVRDQPALTALFDLTQARSCDSFDKCYRDIAALIRAARTKPK